MRASGTALALAVRSGAFKLGLLGLGCLASQGLFGAGAATAASKAAPSDAVAEGREVFNREWLPDDPRGHGGDGLGPVYNDTSCVACHNSGGIGGAGPVSKNIDILNATRNRNQQVQPQSTRNTGDLARAPKIPAANLEPLVALHAGFKNGRTVVLHRFGTDPNYENWRRAVSQGQLSQAMDVLPNSNMNPSNINPFNSIDEGEILDGRVTQTLAATDLGGLAPATLTTATISGPAPALFGSGIEELRVEPGGNVSSGRMLIHRRSNSAVAQMPQAQAQAVTPEMRAQIRMQEARNSMQAVGNMQMQVGEFTVSRSQRNPTPLFGLGLIDAIPEKAIEEAAARRFPEFPEVQGRVSRLKDGRVGRLGWKGQTANSEDFVLTACAVELGLEVPGHNQAVVPQAPKYRAGGMDLSGSECDSLVAYVRSLPKPQEREGSNAEEAKVLAAGKSAFAGAGCASCHTPQLGAVAGLYSDLLLHDMGPEMADLGSYNGGNSTDDDSEPLGPLANTDTPADVAEGQAPAPTPVAAVAVALKGANRQEWRTPPLWGMRDSAPYLHDGRAQTLEQAIALHGGQAAGAANRYFKLSAKERGQIEAFLKSLVAPTQLAQAGD